MVPEKFSQRLELSRVVGVYSDVLGGQIGSEKYCGTAASLKSYMNIATGLGQIKVSPDLVEWGSNPSATYQLIANQNIYTVRTNR